MSKICTKILHVLLVDYQNALSSVGRTIVLIKKKKKTLTERQTESHESMTREEIDKKTGSGSRAEISVLGPSHLWSVTCMS